MVKEALILHSKTPLSFSLDTLAKAIYITFSTNPVKKTVRKNSSLSIDYDKDGNMVGIEVIRIQKIKATIQKILKDTENSLPESAKRIVDSLALSH